MFYHVCCCSYYKTFFGQFACFWSYLTYFDFFLNEKQVSCLQNLCYFLYAFSVFLFICPDLFLLIGNSFLELLYPYTTTNCHFLHQFEYVTQVFKINFKAFTSYFTELQHLNGSIRSNLILILQMRTSVWYH